MQPGEKKSNYSQKDSSSLFVPALSSVPNSSGRTKIMLKPGRSLMDWIRFTHSAEDLSSTGGRVLEVSNYELAKHDSVHDAWIALRGKVYNVTHYLEYHPGGKEELMKGAGRDATELFDQVHRWVNAETMLQKCFVGFLNNSKNIDVPKLPNIKQLKIKRKKSTPVENIQYVNKKHHKLKEVSEQTVQIKSTWLILPSSDSNENDLAMRCDVLKDSLILQLRSSNIKLEGLITDLVEKELYVQIKKTPVLYFNIGLSATYQEFYKVTIENDSVLEFSLKKIVPSRPTEYVDSNVKFALCDPADIFIYWSCKLVSKIIVNYNTFIFTFMLPSGTKMWVPMGCHVLIRASVEGTEIIRSYTPLPSYVLHDRRFDDEQDGTKITLMIKIYQSGTLTPVIDNCKLGEYLCISNYLGNFNESFVVDCDSLIMLAAGTGITPMIKIVCYIITNKNIKRSLKLLFFNKTEEDILLRKELEEIKSTYSEFQVHHILSEPNSKWTGYTGQLNKDICVHLLTKENSLKKQRILICGPIPFTVNALSYLEEAGYSKDDIYVFSGS